MRVTQAGILPPRAVFRGMAVALGLATLTGVYLASVAGWPVIVIGLVSMLMAVCYTGGPYPLSYNGLGDVFVFVFFGLVATATTYYVQAQAWSADAILAGAGLGFFSTAMLVVNNLRDRETDGAAGKRTLAVRFGDRFTVIQYFACLALAASASAIGVSAMGWSRWTLLSLAGIAASAPAWVRVAPFLRPGAGDGAVGERGPANPQPGAGDDRTGARAVRGGPGHRRARRLTGAFRRALSGGRDSSPRARAWWRSTPAADLARRAGETPEATALSWG